MIDPAACAHLREQEMAVLRQLQHSLDEGHIAYLPSLFPLKRVDYVIVSPEPSLSWAKNKSPHEIEMLVAAGYRNFMYSWEDFILHHCLKKQLRLYHLTSISKAAVAQTQEASLDTLQAWLPSFREELALVSTPDTQLIPLGQKAAELLQSLDLPYPVTEPLIHFARMASRWRSRLPSQYPEAYAEQAAQWQPIQLIRSADHTLMTLFQIEERNFGTPIPYDLIQNRLSYLKDSKAGLSESRKQLIFTYLKQLEHLRRPA